MTDPSLIEPKEPVDAAPDACLVCGPASFRLIYQKEQWRYWQCCACGLVHLHPRPGREALIDDYQDYLSSDTERIEQWERMMRRINVRSADLIERRLGRKGKVLDVGCGYGFFLCEMQKRGWQVEGVELSPIGRAAAADIPGIRLHSVPLETLALPDETFDVVTLFYVIEHLPDPLDLLREVRRILKPDGLILLRWPHTAPMLKILGRFVKNYDYFHTPFHLYDFSPATITQLLERSGFDQGQTLIGGYSLPAGRLNRWFTVFCGSLAEALYLLSAGRCLMPGVSKTTLAIKSFAANKENKRSF